MRAYTEWSWRTFGWSLLTIFALSSWGQTARRYVELDARGWGHRLGSWPLVSGLAFAAAFALIAAAYIFRDAACGRLKYVFITAALLAVVTGGMFPHTKFAGFPSNVYYIRRVVTEDREGNFHVRQETSLEPFPP